MFQKRMGLPKVDILFIFSLTLLESSLAFGSTYNDGRIINGTLAAVNATRHQVSVRRKLSDDFFFGTGHICGGSLIAPNVVLTAAHCFVDQFIFDGTFLPHTDFNVVMGNLDRFEKNNLTLIFDIEEIVFDLPIFNLKTYEKDIALLFLNDSVPVNHSSVQPILINRNPMPGNTSCQVTGWGNTEYGYGSDELMTVDVPIIDTDVCLNDTDFRPGSIREGMMCAGYLDEGARDACNGDSGGPLVCKQLLTGIVSWGRGCALPRLPGVYTDVAFWAPWIDDRLKERNMTLPGGKNGSMKNVRYSMILLSALFIVESLIS